MSMRFLDLESSYFWTRSLGTLWTRSLPAFWTGSPRSFCTGANLASSGGLAVAQRGWVLALGVVGATCRQRGLC